MEARSPGPQPDRFVPDRAGTHTARCQGRVRERGFYLHPGEDSPMALLFLSIMGAFAEFERALIRERQREGIALARQRGAYPARAPGGPRCTSIASHPRATRGGCVEGRTCPRVGREPANALQLSPAHAGGRIGRPLEIAAIPVGRDARNRSS